MLGQVQSAAIYHELARILQSEGFQRSARLRKFLSVVVDQTLRGKAAEIKELTLAVMVFGRDPSPSTPSVTRSSASRRHD
jgi:hypothetical protein